MVMVRMLLRTGETLLGAMADTVAGPSDTVTVPVLSVLVFTVKVSVEAVVAVMNSAVKQRIKVEVVETISQDPPSEKVAVRV
jgi:hypothetical protein